MVDVSPEELYALAEKVGAALMARGLMMATAESCTGGWIGEAVTAVPGSSQWFERGFITYTNEAKREMLDVCEATLNNYGAVSELTVREMAVGALNRSRAQVAVAVSGIAGPTGGTPGKPVGMVCLAWATQAGEVRTETYRFQGDRRAVRAQAVVVALSGLLGILGEPA
jgi:nicotinamide-nucleotide amidase